jgi:hypothetical protein
MNDMKEISLTVGILYAYENRSYVSSLETGYFLGTCSKPVPSQSFNDDTEYEICYVFGSRPTRQIHGKYNEFVFQSLLGKIYDLVEHKEQ